MSADINRRSFMQLLGLATATVVLPKELLAEALPATLDAEKRKDGVYLYFVGENNKLETFAQCHNLLYKRSEPQKYLFDNSPLPLSHIWGMPVEPPITIEIIAFFNEANANLADTIHNWFRAVTEGAVHGPCYRQVLARCVIGGNVVHECIFESTYLGQWAADINLNSSVATVDFTLFAESITKVAS